MTPWFDTFLIGTVIALILMICLSFIRAVKGPTVADRIIGVNMIGTLVIITIAVLTIYLGEAWLADIAAIYAMISFIGIVALTKIYIGIYRERQEKKKNE